MLTLKSILTDLSKDQVNQIVETGFRGGHRCKSYSNSHSSKSSYSKSGDTSGRTRTRTRTGK